MNAQMHTKQVAMGLNKYKFCFTILLARVRFINVFIFNQTTHVSDVSQYICH